MKIHPMNSYFTLAMTCSLCSNLVQRLNVSTHAKMFGNLFRRKIQAALTRLATWGSDLNLPRMPVASEGKNRDPLLKMETPPLVGDFCIRSEYPTFNLTQESAQNSYKTPRKNAGCFFYVGKKWSIYLREFRVTHFFPAHPCADVF